MVWGDESVFARFAFIFGGEMRVDGDGVSKYQYSSRVPYRIYEGSRQVGRMGQYCTVCTESNREFC